MFVGIDYRAEGAFTPPAHPLNAAGINIRNHSEGIKIREVSRYLRIVVDSRRRRTRREVVPA